MLDLDKARAVLTDLATMSTRDVCAKHDVTPDFANRLVTDPPRALRDADWYRSLVKPIKDRRARSRPNVVGARSKRV